MNTTSLLDKVRATLNRYQLIDSGDIVCVMLSGGGDSVALLRALYALQEEYGHELIAFHLNHQLRGESAAGDEAFVRALCDELSVPLHVDSVDVAAYAEERKLNLEDAGRRVRYDRANAYLNAYREERGARPNAGKLATGHNRDDRIETFFARALFGAGAGGLGSIKPRRDHIIRPLIEVDRAELRDHLAAEGHTWREDESNSDTTRTRAFIRAKLIPVAEELNPAFRDALERSMNLVADDDELLSGMANSFARDFTDDRVPGDHIIFNISFMRTLEPTMARRAIRAGVMQTFPESSRIEAAHIQALADNMDCDGYVQDLPDNLRAEVKSGTLKVTKKRAQESWSDVVLTTEGETDLGLAGVLILEEVDPKNLLFGSHIANVDADVFLGSLTAGPARNGERMRPLGMSEGSQLLSDIFIDAKVPKEERLFVPVVRDASEVVWVGGQKIADRYKVTEQTKRVWQFEWIEDKDRAMLADGRGQESDE